MTDLTPEQIGKRRAKNRAHYAVHRDRILKRHQEYREANRDKLRKARLDYYVANKEKERAYQVAHKEQIRERDRKRRLRQYGIDYERLAKEQNYCCKLCGREEWACHHGVLVVDHDHATGKVRALLCSNCNAGLGAFKDNPKLLERAAEYLREYNH